MEGKSADWKRAIAAELKRRSTVTNRGLAETMQMGNLHEVGRKVAAWQRKPEKRIQSLLVKTPRLTLSALFWSLKNRLTAGWGA